MGFQSGGMVPTMLEPGEITKLVNATGFRTGGAFFDPSQNVNVVKHGNHYFNTAGNNVMGFQSGGMVPTMLEPGEKVFAPGQWNQSISYMNESIPRFQSGGQVGSMRGNRSDPMMMEVVNKSIEHMSQQIIKNDNAPQSRATPAMAPPIPPNIAPGGGRPDIPVLPNDANNSFSASLVMARDLLSANLGG